MLIDTQSQTISFKIVYYGPSLSGKTTNLAWLSDYVRSQNPDAKPMRSLATRGARTLYFDYLSLNLGKIGHLNANFHLYTTPGQDQYEAVRRLVMSRVDAIIFVADSQYSQQQNNLRALIQRLGADHYPAIEACANQGQGVTLTLETTMQTLVKQVSKQLKIRKYKAFSLSKIPQQLSAV